MRKFISSPLFISWINSIFGLLGFLFIVPIASAHLSGTQFTLWLFANSVIAVGILFESSVSVVFTRTLTSIIERRSLADKYRSETENIKLAEFVCASFVLYVTVALLGGVISYSAGLSSINSLVQVGLASIEAKLSLLSIAAIVFTGVILSFGRSVLIADKKLRLQRYIMLITTVGKLVVSAAIFAKFEKVDLALISIAFVNLIEAFTIVKLSWSLQKLVFIARPKLYALGEFSSPFLKTLIIRIGGYLTMYSSSLIVVRYLPNEADAYLLSFRLVQAAASVSLIPVSISLSALTRMRARVNAGSVPTGAFVDSALQIIGISVSCMFFLSLGLLLFGSLILEFATNGKSLLGKEQLAYMCWIFLLESHHVAHAMVYETQNRVPFLGISIISGLAIFFLSIFFVPYFGVWGLLVVLNFVQMCANNWVPVWCNLQQWDLLFGKYLSQLIKVAIFPSISRMIDPDA